MRFLAAALIWWGTTFPAAYLYSERYREPAFILFFFGFLFTLWAFSQKEER